jgi:hypothetical protein
MKFDESKTSRESLLTCCLEAEAEVSELMINKSIGEEARISKLLSINSKYVDS